MNRAERRRTEREAKRNRKRQGGNGEHVVFTHSPRGESPDPCPNGHPDQFEAVVLNGGEPWPCKRCGETPRFGPIEQNIDPDLPGYVDD